MINGLYKGPQVHPSLFSESCWIHVFHFVYINKDSRLFGIPCHGYTAMLITASPLESADKHVMPGGAQQTRWAQLTSEGHRCVMRCCNPTGVKPSRPGVMPEPIMCHPVGLPSIIGAGTVRIWDQTAGPVRAREKCIYRTSHPATLGLYTTSPSINWPFLLVIICWKTAVANNWRIARSCKIFTGQLNVWVMLTWSATFLLYILIESGRGKAERVRDREAHCTDHTPAHAQGLMYGSRVATL